MAKAKKKKCSPPSGLSTSRSRSTISFSWSGGYNESVQFQYALNNSGTWSYSSVINKGANATSHAIGISTGNYYPSKSVSLRQIAFRVRGDKKKEKKTNWQMSNWSSWSYFNVVAPAAPKVTYEKSSLYRTTFTMEIPNHINDRGYWGTHVQYRTCLRIDCDDITGKEIPESAWSSITNNTIYNSITQNDTTTFTYEANDENNSGTIKTATNAVRWFASRTIGPYGASAWVIIGVSYSEPYPGVVTKSVVKQNSRNGLDCSVDFDYQISRSRPIDTIKIQYSFASPGGIYSEYSLTNDPIIKTNKNYYTLTPTQVSNPSTDELANYYEKYEQYTSVSRTKSQGLESNVTYYSAEEVIEPDVSDIDDYWEYSINENTIREVVTDEEDIDYAYVVVDRTYHWSRTIDTAINEDKVYYVISEVANPTIDGLPETLPETDESTYLLKENTYYVKTTDIILNKNKKYYTVDASLVVYPDVADIHTYYDLISVNYIAPISPSWQDAEIGGDNTIVPSRSLESLTTCSSKVSFQIDGEMPQDQLLYVRVITTHNNLSTYGAYYMCTDENGNNIYRETLLTDPTINSVSLGSDNFISFSATNTSQAEGVKLAVLLLPPEGNDNTETISVEIPNQNGEVNTTIEVPPKYLTTGFGIGVYAFIGQHGFSGRIEDDESGLGYNLYAINSILKSKLVTFGGAIPVPPTNVGAEHIGNGNVLVTWDWNWKDADYAEVAWSDYSEALDSTEQPSTYQVPNSKNNRLIVRSLETGKTWYFWVRLGKDENASIWSNVVFENLSSSPSIPSLSLSRRYITLDDKFTANWTYVSTDGTTQYSAQICMCDVSGNDVFYGNIIAEIPNDDVEDRETQYVVLDPRSDRLSWSEGNDYYLAVQVTSTSGMISEKWSDYVPITVVQSVNSSLSSSSLYPPAIDYNPEETYSIGDYAIKKILDPDDMSKEKGVLYKCISDISEPEEWNEEHWAIDEEQQYQELRSLPLTVTVESTNDNVDTTLIIERSRDYFLDRPDGSSWSGHEGETVVQMTDTIDDSFEINQEDLSSYLDDGAYYYMTTRVTDNYGQSKEVRYEFVVNWSHQALMPSATTTIDHDYSVVKINVDVPENIPTGYDISGDVCDIYRQSADGFVLLYEGAHFNNVYVDPYPTLGDHGGYRICYRTKNGDYITEDKAFAWLDLDDDEDMIYSPSHIIDFEDDMVEIMYNVDIDNSWHKDFQETKYLGGSIQGDWNIGVSKTTNISCNILTSDWQNISAMRRLASYNGECHVRTRDGSNFLANVEVSERLPYAVYTDPNRETTQICEYSLSITKLDPIEPDGMTLADWNEYIKDEATE